MNSTPIQGECAPRFEQVRAVFEDNFAERGEVGAAVAVYLRGKPVVDLWGGIADAQSGRPWARDTLVCMMSVAKGVLALLVHRLASQGVIALDQPITRWWPEFGAAGKHTITLRQVLAHVAGLPYADGLPRGSLYDWSRVTEALAAQAPAFPPGEVRCYHSATMGFIVGEVLRRATGTPIGELLTAELCGPLGAEFRIGLSPSEQARCATMIPSEGNILDIARAKPESLFGKMWFPIADDEDFDGIPGEARRSRPPMVMAPRAASPGSTASWPASLHGVTLAPWACQRFAKASLNSGPGANTAPACSGGRRLDFFSTGRPTDPWVRIRPPSAILALGVPRASATPTADLGSAIARTGCTAASTSGHARRRSSRRLLRVFKR